MNTANYPLERLRAIAPALRMMRLFPTRPAREISTQLGIERSEIAAWVECNHNRRPSNADIEAMELRLQNGDEPEETKIPIPKPVCGIQPPAVLSRSSATAIQDEAARPSAVQPPPEAPKPAQPAAPAAAPALMATGNAGRWLEQFRCRITGQVQVFQIEVTPALAEAWLKCNTGNRKPSKAKIRRFVVAMKAGRWILNGETIKFSLAGRLLDGQSRLMAIVEAGVTVILEVRFGLPDVAQKTIDIGEIRKTSHTLEMMGEHNPGALAAALKLVWLLDIGKLGGGPAGRARVLENHEVPALIARHADLKLSVGWAVRQIPQIKLLMPLSEMAFWHHVLGLADPALRDPFLEALIDGTALTKLSPVYHLRQWLLTARADRAATHAAARPRRAMFIKGWNLARQGGKVSSLVFKDGEVFPTLDGYTPPGAGARQSPHDGRAAAQGTHPPAPHSARQGLRPEAEGLIVASRAHADDLRVARAASGSA